jgi:class 3 adenylate cyclase/tetratricopeptide (TPR) repeat protein
MKCPRCGFENIHKAKFCNECGNKLDVACTSCQTPNPPGSKFCHACGQNLIPPAKPSPKDLSFDEKIERIQRYLPEGITEKILNQRDKIEGERKQVTVLFCDMAGFTSLSEKVGPEEAYGLMDQVYEILIHKVHDYGGTVNEMTGDGIMALFGAPIALEDASQRAIKSSLAIHREIGKFNDRMKQERQNMPLLKMRIGIHTGPVVVGTLGNDLRVEFKAVGDTVNLASRMEGLAEPGATYVTEDTFRLTEGLFRFEALGAKKVKGKEEAVNVFRVVASGSGRTRFDVSAERGLTPFVGRERELELLLDCFQWSKKGRGQAFSIMADAGLGKSRLLYEFRKTVSNEDVTFLEGRCLSYSRGVAYHPMRDVLKANFHIGEGDGDSEIREKVKKGLKVLGVDEALTLPYFLELLSVKDSGIDDIPMSHAGRKDRIIEAFKLITLKGSEIRPLIVAYEDLHWVDKSSEDVLKYVLESIPGARVLLIFTYRPEFVHTWGGKSFHNQVTLNRLSNRETLSMASHLLGTEDVDRNLEELVLDKTEGVPFFIEEFIRSLKDLQIIGKKDNRYLIKDIQKVTIPSTIQDLMMARVDSLPDSAKEVLQTGSVIEREFSYELIKRVMGLPEQKLLSHLSILKDSELLYERGIYPQSTYIFKHALTQEVVYDSMLNKRKKTLHEQIGNAIENLYKGDIDEYYGVLAGHYIMGQNYEKGAEYSRLAGKKAQKAGSFKEAIEYAEKSVFSLERLPVTSATQKKIIDARTRLAGYNISLTHHVEAKDAVAPIANLALELSYQKRLPIIYTAMGTHSHLVEESYSEAFRYLNEALKMSEKTKDTTSLYYASLFLGCILSSNCEFEQGLEFFKKSLDLGVLTKNPIAILSAKTSMSALGYMFYGKIDRAYQISQEAFQVAQEIGDIYLKGMAYASYGMSCYGKGLFDEAKNSLSQAILLCERTAQLGWGSWAFGFLGRVYCGMAEHERAQYYYKEGISTLERGGLLPSCVNLWKISMARSKALNNETDIKLSDVFKYYEGINFRAFKGWAERYIGEILMNIDDLHLSEAVEWTKKAIETDKQNGTMWFLGCDYALWAELFRRKGDKSKARQNLNTAIEIFKECGADGWVKRTEEEMAILS